jgi:hypothetical protein
MGGISQLRKHAAVAVESLVSHRGVKEANEARRVFFSPSMQINRLSGSVKGPTKERDPIVRSRQCQRTPTVHECSAHQNQRDENAGENTFRSLCENGVHDVLNQRERFRGPLHVLGVY